LTDYELDAKGERLSTRFAPGYLQMMADFIWNGALKGAYNDAVLTPRQGR
jgi:uncharacterized protein